MVHLACCLLAQIGCAPCQARLTEHASGYSTVHVGVLSHNGSVCVLMDQPVVLFRALNTATPQSMPRAWRQHRALAWICYCLALVGSLQVLAAQCVSCVPLRAASFGRVCGLRQHNHGCAAELPAVE